MTNAQAEPLWTLREVADELRISERTVRRMVKRGELPAYQVAGKYVIKQSDLDSYLDANKTNGDNQ